MDDFESSPDAISVKLDTFEGPLDLLLHLIRQHKVDIYDIPIALITQQFYSLLDSASVKYLVVDELGTAPRAAQASGSGSPSSEQRSRSAAATADSSAMNGTSHCRTNQRRPRTQPARPPALRSGVRGRVGALAALGGGDACPGRGHAGEERGDSRPNPRVGGFARVERPGRGRGARPEDPHPVCRTSASPQKGEWRGPEHRRASW